jgi:hypothetical protein
MAEPYSSIAFIHVENPRNVFSAVLYSIFLDQRFVYTFVCKSSKKVFFCCWNLLHPPCSLLDNNNIGKATQSKERLREWEGRLSMPIVQWLTGTRGTASSKHPHCKEIPIYVFLEKELRGLSPGFHIHVSVSEIMFLE